MSRLHAKLLLIAIGIIFVAVPVLSTYVEAGRDTAPVTVATEVAYHG